MGNGSWMGAEIRARKSARRGVWTLGAILVLAAAVLISIRPHGLPQADVSAPKFVRSSHSKPDAGAILGQLPMIFEPNLGQADAQTKFVAHAAGYGLSFDGSGAVLSLRAPSTDGQARLKSVHMKLVGANSSIDVAGVNALPGKSNYLVGNDPQKWHRGIPQFAGVRYRSVYPGIDLVFYGHQGQLEYDFRVAPGADPSRAELQFDRASKIEESAGDLLLTSGADTTLRLHAPEVYQLEGSRRQPVAGHFVLHAGNRVSFDVAPYDRSRELVIDPVLTFSSYFGGTGAETYPSIAVNGDGFIYIVGSTTTSTGFPAAATVTQVGPQPHIFVAKINPAQPSFVVFETFLGGSGTDTSIGLGVDNGSNIYFAGNTTSTDFPVKGNPYQSAPETKGTQCASVTCHSIFASVLSGTDLTGATLKYSTYLSGNGDDVASGLGLDAQGDVFLTGTTTSNQATQASTDEFPATHLPVPYQALPAPGATIQFFATKLDTNIPSVGGIAYSTYFGGGTPVPAVAVGGGIAVDSTGNMYFSGTTNFFNSGLGQFGNSSQSVDFPILNSYQPCLDTPPPTTLSNPNPCTAPTTTPYPTDAFVAKINPLAAAGSQLLFSTFLGGTQNDSSTAVAIDPGAANVYLTGSTNSPDFILPTGSTAYQTCLDTSPTITTCPTIAQPAPTDAYAARFTNPVVGVNGTSNFVALNYFSYLGGSANDSGLAISADTSTVSGTSLNDVLITGATSSTDFPVTAGAIQSTYGSNASGSNAFFAEIDTSVSTVQNQAGSYVTYFGGSGTDRGTSIAVDPFLNSYFAGDTTSPNLQVQNPLPGETALNGSSDAFVVKLQPANALSVSSVAPVLSPAGFVSAGNSVAITFTVSNEGLDPATGIAVTGSVSAGVTFSSATAQTGTCSTPANNGVVCTIPTLQAGSTAQVVFNVTPTTSGSYSALISVVNVNNTTTNITNSAAFEASTFSMSVSPSSQTIPAGQIARYTVQLNPNPVFGTVSLSCSSPPTGATCSFSNSSLTLSSGNSSTSLSINTTAQPVSTVRSGWQRAFYALWLGIPGLGWLGLTASGTQRKWRARLLGLLALVLFSGLVVLQPSCSSSKTPPPVTGTPSGTYSMRVTATSGSYSQSQTFQLTVIP